MWAFMTRPLALRPVPNVLSSAGFKENLKKSKAATSKENQTVFMHFVKIKKKKDSIMHTGIQRLNEPREQ